MRTPDADRKRARDLYALARSAPHADDGLVYVLRAMELEAAGRGTIAEPKTDRRGHTGSELPAAKRAGRA